MADVWIVEEKAGIEDKTETNLVNLRRVIYLTLQNAVSRSIFACDPLC